MQRSDHSRGLAILAVPEVIEWHHHRHDGRPEKVDNMAWESRTCRTMASTSDVKFVACRVFLILPLRASELLGLVALSMSLRL